MNSRTLLLTSILFLGITFQNCSESDCPCCDGSIGIDTSPFFDIQGTETAHFNQNFGLVETDQIAFEEYGFINLRFLVDYVATHHNPNRRHSFSLMNSAYACSYIGPGLEGSKEESIVSLQVITINDFDNDHRSGDSINDLLELDTTTFPLATSGILPLEEFLISSTDNVPSENFFMRLLNRPTLNNEFQVRIEVSLSTGERYETTSPVIEFL